MPFLNANPQHKLGGFRPDWWTFATQNHAGEQWYADGVDAAGNPVPRLPHERPDYDVHDAKFKLLFVVLLAVQLCLVWLVASREARGNLKRRLGEAAERVRRAEREAAEKEKEVVGDGEGDQEKESAEPVAADSPEEHVEAQKPPAPAPSDESRVLSEGTFDLSATAQPAADADADADEKAPLLSATDEVGEKRLLSLPGAGKRLSVEPSAKAGALVITVEEVPEATTAVGNAPTADSSKTKKTAAAARPRAFHLDLIRITFALLMLLEHAGHLKEDLVVFEAKERYPLGSLLLQAVPPYFFGISGFVFTMSGKPVWGALFRLVKYLLIGMACNLTGAFLADGSAQKAEFRARWMEPWILMYTLFFIVGLAIAMLLCAPLRSGLQRLRKCRQACLDVEKEGVRSADVVALKQQIQALKAPGGQHKETLKELWISAGSYLFVTALAAASQMLDVRTMFANGSTQDPSMFAKACQQMPPAYTCGVILGAIASCLLYALTDFVVDDPLAGCERVLAVLQKKNAEESTEEDSIVLPEEYVDQDPPSVHRSHPRDATNAGWVILLFCSFVHRTLFPHPQAGYVTGFCMFVYGCFLFHRPLVMPRVPVKSGPSVPLVQILRAYALLVFIGLICVGFPTITGRPDMYPLLRVHERLRYYAVDVVVQCLLWLGFFELQTDPLGALSWLNDWSLCVFLVHPGWLQLCDGYGCSSAGVLGMLLLAPVFWWRSRGFEVDLVKGCFGLGAEGRAERRSKRALEDGDLPAAEDDKTAKKAKGRAVSRNSKKATNTPAVTVV